MPDGSSSNDKLPSPQLTNEGARRALNYVLDIAKRRKHVVTFYWDPDESCIREVGTRGKIPVVIDGSRKS
nr:hypothetical protein 20 [Balneolaceae bacterium]